MSNMNPSLSMFSYRKLLFSSVYSARRYAFYVLLAFAVLLMAWESAAQDAAIVGQSIPEQSIRLRILANSDSPADQLLKRQVRDAVIEQMNRWVNQPDDIQQARNVIQANIPQIEQLVQNTLHLYGYDYSFDVEFGAVDFPTKLYGNKVYPAGEYEALRISSGEGEGQNWWCVLFPPLCFVDMASGVSEPVEHVSTVEDDSAASDSTQGGMKADEVDGATTEEKNVNADADEDDRARELRDREANVVAASADADQPVSEQETEARFFLWEVLQSLWRWISSFAS